MNGLDLFSGIGGFCLGMRLAVGPTYLTVAHVEREVHCANVLAARMEEGHLENAPIWDNIVTFDGRAFRGLVDIVTASPPCQPYSVAGKLRGNKDGRALSPELVRIVRECEPRYVFIENVPGYLKHFGPVYDALRGMGFNVAPPAAYTAYECGATHGRSRVFILAARGLDRGRNFANPNRRRREGERSGWLLDKERKTLRHDTDRCGDGCGICGTQWASESPVLRVDDGTTGRVDELHAIGNGVVPAVVARAWRDLSGRFN